jgi:hypothetical protein
MATKQLKPMMRKRERRPLLLALPHNPAPQRYWYKLRTSQQGVKE